MEDGKQAQALPAVGRTPQDWLAANAGAPAAAREAVALLEALERRALEEALPRLAPGFTMVFPGPARFTDLQAMVEGAKRRYRRVAKLVEDVDAFERDGDWVVYVRGTLYGENLRGVPFEGIRFIDRFESRGGRFTRQDVWNDLAESGVLSRRD